MSCTKSSAVPSACKPSGEKREAVGRTLIGVVLTGDVLTANQWELCVAIHSVVYPSRFVRTHACAEAPHFESKKVDIVHALILERENN